MIISIIVMSLQICFSLVMIFMCGCFGGSNDKNNLLCWLHYMKLVHNSMQISKFSSSIKDKLPNHSLGAINTYITFMLYYGGLFFYSGMLSEANMFWLILCVSYPASDVLIMLFSAFKVMQVKKVKHKFETQSHELYQQTAKDTAERLKEIMYLPIEYESDIAEDEDD